MATEQSPQRYKIFARIEGETSRLPFLYVDGLSDSLPGYPINFAKQPVGANPNPAMVDAVKALTLAAVASALESAGVEVEIIEAPK